MVYGKRYANQLETQKIKFMDKETSIQLLHRFTDINRHNMSNPFRQDLTIGKYLCATNGDIVVLIPETKENQIGESNIKYPNINGILPEFKDDALIDFEYILKLYSDVPIIEMEITEDCESCDGKGVFTHYKYTYDCKYCDEKGKIGTGTNEKIKDPNTVFRFKEINVPIKYIKELIIIYNTKKNFQTDKQMRGEYFMTPPPIKFKIVHFGKSLIWFKIDDIFIGIASASPINESKWKVVNINIDSN
jgi:hypothetical protein